MRAQKLNLVIHQGRLLIKGIGENIIIQDGGTSECSEKYIVERMQSFATISGIKQPLRSWHFRNLGRSPKALELLSMVLLQYLKETKKKLISTMWQN